MVAINLDAKRQQTTVRYETSLRVLRAAQAHLEGARLENIRPSESARLFFRRANSPS